MHEAESRWQVRLLLNWTSEGNPRLKTWAKIQFKLHQLAVKLNSTQHDTLARRCSAKWEMRTRGTRAWQHHCVDSAHRAAVSECQSEIEGWLSRIRKCIWNWESVVVLPPLCWTDKHWRHSSSSALISLWVHSLHSQSCMASSALLNGASIGCSLELKSALVSCEFSALNSLA